MYEIEFYDYCAARIVNFEERAQAARAIMDTRRCDLYAADFLLWYEVCRLLEDFCQEIGADPEEVDDII